MDSAAKPSDPIRDADADETLVKVTPAMIEAAVTALARYCPMDFAFPAGGEEIALQAVLKAALQVAGPGCSSIEYVAPDELRAADYATRYRRFGEHASAIIGVYGCTDHPGARMEIDALWRRMMGPFADQATPLEAFRATTTPWAPLSVERSDQS